MDRKQAIRRLDELGALAQERMKNAPDQPGLVFAEIFWMTDQEVRERADLIEILRTSEDSAASAAERIRQKIARRKRDR